MNNLKEGRGFSLWLNKLLYIHEGAVPHPRREQHYQQMNEQGTLCYASSTVFENKGDKESRFSVAFIFLSAIVTELLH